MDYHSSESSDDELLEEIKVDEKKEEEEEEEVEEAEAEGQPAEDGDNKDTHEPEKEFVHGQDVFLGSEHDPLHPEKLNTGVLESSKLWTQAVVVAKKSSDDDTPDVKSKSRSGSQKANSPMTGGFRSGADRRVKGCPPEVQQQYRELLDAGLISRADYLKAIEKYIANLPEDLKPDDDEEGSGSDNGGSDESSDVSLDLADSEDDEMDEGDDEDDIDDDVASDEDEVPPEGYVHTPLTSGDATNYPIKGDSCVIHFEGRIPPDNPDDPDAEAVVFDSSYVRKETVNIQVGRGDCIKGIDYALRFMTPGQKSHLVIPPQWAYGAVGYPPLIDSNQTLHFEVELLRFSNDADARVKNGRPPNPIPIGMDQFTHGEFDMNELTMQAESSYYQAISESLPK